MAHIQKFLLELVQGFAFVGRQVHPEIGDGAQLGISMTAADRLLAHPDEKSTLGLLLVREKNRALVEQTLGGSVAERYTQLRRALPSALKGSLPSIEENEAELSGDVGRRDE